MHGLFLARYCIVLVVARYLLRFGVVGSKVVARYIFNIFIVVAVSSTQD